MHLWILVLFACAPAPGLRSYTSTLDVRSNAGTPGVHVGSRDGPRMVGGRVEMTGPLASEELEAAMQRRRNQLAYCHRRLIDDAPRPTVSIALTFTVAETGAVVSVSHDGADVSAPLGDCLTRQVAQLQLSSTKLETRVRYPLSFSVRATDSTPD